MITQVGVLLVYTKLQLGYDMVMIVQSRLLTNRPLVIVWSKRDKINSLVKNSIVALSLKSTIIIIFL